MTDLVFPPKTFTPIALLFQIILFTAELQQQDLSPEAIGKYYAHFQENNFHDRESCSHWLKH
jgi:hypothetical protein